jgi:hypothetical protein
VRVARRLVIADMADDVAQALLGPPNGEAQPAARGVQRCEPLRAVGIHQDEKSQREGGRLQQVLGGAAGVTSFRSAHTPCNDFGSALHTDRHGKHEPW